MIFNFINQAIIYARNLILLGSHLKQNNKTKETKFLTNKFYLIKIKNNYQLVLFNQSLVRDFNYLFAENKKQKII